MSYSLDQFKKDAHDILKADPGPAGRTKVAEKLGVLLRDDGFIAAYCTNARPGRHVIWEDPENHWQIMVHHMPKGHIGAPHDHGASWAIYGQAIKHTDMSLWKRLDDGKTPGKARVEKVKEYRLTRGKAGVYNGNEIHSIAYPDGAVFVRVTGCDLDLIERLRYDTSSGAVKAEKSASMLHASVPIGG